VILLRVFPDSDRFVAELWKRDNSGEPTGIWKHDLRPNDQDTTTPILMEIQLADLYGNDIPLFLQGTGPIVLNVRRMASNARNAKEKMAAEALKRKRKEASDTSDRRAGTVRKKKKGKVDG